MSLNLSARDENPITVNIRASMYIQVKFWGGAFRYSFCYSVNVCLEKYWENVERREREREKGVKKRRDVLCKKKHVECVEYISMKC